MKQRSLLIQLLIILCITLPTVLLLWVPVMFGYGKFDQWRYDTPDAFSAEEWQVDKKYRWVSIDLLIEAVLEPGMTGEELLGILGAPDAILSEGKWWYQAKRPGWTVIDFSGGGLVLEFEGDGNLSKAVNATYID